jgi:hypothetical protein
MSYIVDGLFAGCLVSPLDKKWRDVDATGALLHDDRVLYIKKTRTSANEGGFISFRWHNLPGSERDMGSLRRLGSPHRTPGSASPDCSGFAFIGETESLKKYSNGLSNRWPKITSLSKPAKIIMVLYVEYYI